MRIALLTDLHANREALDAVLAHASGERIDRHALLGDFVGYGAEPAWVVDRARELAAAGAIVVQGNHDEAVVHGSRASMRPDARHSIEWTRARLDAEQLAFLAALPMSHTEGPALYVHANAWDPPKWSYIETRHDAVRSMHATTCRYTFCGHMHEPMLYHLSRSGKAGDFKPVAGVTIPMPPHRQWLVVPGSVGQPRDNNPAACYAVFDLEQAQVTYHRVAYDHEAAAAKVRAAGLPQNLAERLADGS
ncbi:MAG TPA: metallophosphoesterase family protein [Burkholderiaceae bacterium]|nr:metallophosphoesterase family protein [Burkholderiaceae bacterium]